MVKFLWNCGVETFLAAGRGIGAPSTGYLYVFDERGRSNSDALDTAINMGLAIVDGDMLIGGGAPTPRISTSTKIISVTAEEGTDAASKTFQVWRIEGKKCGVFGCFYYQRIF